MSVQVDSCRQDFDAAAESWRFRQSPITGEEVGGERLGQSDVGGPRFSFRISRR
jgi:hypothetical protein